MDLKKCKDNFGIGQTVVSDCFARFAYIFFCSKLNFVHSNTAEEYICFQGLFTLFESVTEHQSAQLLAEEAEYLFGNSLLTRVQNLSIRENSDWKIIANHMVSRLISLNPQSYSIMDGRNENSIQSRGDEVRIKNDIFKLIEL